MSALQGQVALVTGASRGIGAAIASALAQAGATVIGTATTAEGAQQISEHFKRQQLTGYGWPLQVTAQQSVEALLTQLNDNYGTPTILVNNAGITRDNLLLRLKEEDWDLVIATNLSAIYRLSKACLKGMLKAKQGRIINISSVVGATGNAGQSNYAAAKAGIIGFTKSLAQEVASRDITVNAVAPGFIETPMTDVLNENQKQAILQKIPANRFGRPEEVAAAVLFLASPEAGYITGQTLHVNGGMYG